MTYSVHEKTKRDGWQCVRKATQPTKENGFTDYDRAQFDWIMQHGCDYILQGDTMWSIEQ